MPYVAFLHTHTLLVVLYVLLFLIKLILLLSDSSEKLAVFRRKTKIFEMILPVLFIITGIYLTYRSSQFISQPWYIIKIVLLLFAVVAGVFTFRRMSKGLGVLTLLIFIYLFAISYSKSLNPFSREPYVNPLADTANVITDPASPQYDLAAHGRAVYAKYCTSCHGDKGDLGNSGAANLRQSRIDEAGVEDRISRGKNNMPAYQHFLSAQELKAVSSYVMSLRR